MDINRSVVFPTLLTLGNGVCGFAALMVLFKVEHVEGEPALVFEHVNGFATAAWLVLFGMVFDVFDGRVARISGGSSVLGAQLDSLCDLVTFGLVPAVMVVRINHGYPSEVWQKVIWLFSLAYFLGAVLRLARFTAETSPDESAHMAFKGLPTPAAAGCIATLVLFYTYIMEFRHRELQWLGNFVEADKVKAVFAFIPASLPILTLLLGYAMLSNRLVFEHVGSRLFNRKHSFDFFVYMVFGTLLVAVIPEIVLPVLFIGYLVSKPVQLVAGHLRQAYRHVAGRRDGAAAAVADAEAQPQRSGNGTGEARSRARADPQGRGVETSVLIGLGANLGDREANIHRALDLLCSHDEIVRVALSRLRETEPAGGPAQGNYINGAAEIRTTLSPAELLEEIHRVEALLGRVRTVPNAPREIDIDILLYGDDVVVNDESLQIPHVRMLERSFVLEALVDIAPTRRHPVTGRTVAEHWAEMQAPEGGL